MENKINAKEVNGVPETEKELLAIIVLNYRSYDVTIACVDRLLQLGVKYQIVIVDNASPNQSFKILSNRYMKNSNVKVVAAPKNGGYSYGNNIGIREADKIGDFSYYCIMNPDVIIPENYFEDLCIELSARKDYAIITTMMIYPDGLDLSKISFALRTPKEIYRHLFLLNKEADRKCKIRYKYVEDGMIEAEGVPGSLFIIDAATFHKIGLFDENMFLYNEESALAIRLKKINKKCLINITKYYIHNHIYKKESHIVWQRYKTEFQKVLNEYKITYESRKYLCKRYYNGQYLLRLEFVNMVNIALLYIKHSISLFVY